MFYKLDENSCQVLKIVEAKNKLPLQFILCWLFVCSFSLPVFSQTAQEAFLKGNEYLQKGNYSQAITAYQQTIKLNPYHKIAHYNLGRCYQNLNLFNKAEKCLKRALELDTDYIEALNKLGVVLMYQKKYKEAYTCFNHVLEINPIEPEAHYNLASFFQEKHNFERAISHGQRAIKTNPNYVQALIKLGDIYWEAYRDMDKASIYYKRAKELEPRNKLVRSSMAEMYSQKRLIDSAERECLEIINIDPLSSSAMQQLLKIYINNDRPEKIGPLCRKISSITPSSKTFDTYLATLTDLTTLLFDKKMYENATPFCKRITTLIPSNKSLNSYCDTLNRLIRLYLNHNRHKDSIPLCQRAIEISTAKGAISSDKIAYYQLSLACKGMGEYKGCVDAALKACRIDPDDEMCWHIMEKGILDLNRQKVGTPLRNECSKRHLERAQQYLGLGNTFLAKYEYQRAKLLNPQSVPVRLELVSYYEEQGMLFESIEELKKVIELDPKNIVARDKIEMSWKQKTSSFVKETLPDVKKRRVAIIFSAKNPIHLEIDTITEEIAEGFLANSWTIFPLIAKADNLQDAVQAAKSLQASYLLFGEIQEEKGMICIESQLLNLKGVKLKKEQDFLYISRDRDRLTKCLSYQCRDLSNFFPIQGEIVNLNRTNVVLNLGEKHGVGSSSICDALDPAGKKIAEIKIIEVSDSASVGIVTTIAGMRQLLPRNRVSLQKKQVVNEKEKKK